MSFTDKFFKRVENKTNVDKDTIISLANKLENGNMKNEETLKEIIGTLSKITGKEVSEEKQQKIIDAVMNDKVPKNIDAYYDE